MQPVTCNQLYQTSVTCNLYRVAFEYSVTYCPSLSIYYYRILSSRLLLYLMFYINMFVSVLVRPELQFEAAQLTFE